ncbi:Osmotin-like protein OSML13 [Hibiscus syriacus]|uniref:Osmotin-like protein OSML13 n=1 Tax=Hibiscus syriacus TaxID=106335 RepID=A0A6A2Y5Y0_HIBSY|nr:Osmotin-like protein OSML13 [Hibiscus syriacus]
MSYLAISQISSILFFTILFVSAHAALFEIRNDCSYTVWAAASPGGDRRLNPSQSWTINVPAGTSMARIWGRTNCNFDGSGRGRCQTGDCGGLLQCKGWGAPPNTLADGGCRNIRCTADINGQCPNELRAPGGCNNPCTVFKTNGYCCTQGQGTCGSMRFSRFFKQRCPDAYSYPQDDPTSTFICRGGANYRVVFCPRG